MDGRGALDDQSPFRGSTAMSSSSSPLLPQAPVQHLPPRLRDRQGRLPRFPCPGRWPALPPPSLPPPCPPACPPTPQPCGRPTGPPWTPSTRFTWPGLAGSSACQHITLHLSTISWRLLTGFIFDADGRIMDEIFRLANIQRTLLESGAEAAADGENGSREEEVNLKM